MRKTFYDCWDNLFKVVLINIGFMAITAIPAFLPRLTARYIESEALQFVLTAVGVFLCTIFLAASAHSLRKISDYGSFGFTDFFSAFKIGWPAGIVMGLLVFIILLIVSVVIPFYLSMESLAGLFLAALVFWVTVFALLSFQFYFVVCARLGTNLIKAFKKCVLISLDNSGFAFFSFLYSIAALALSVVLVFMFPGPAGVLLFLDQGLRLRLLKYDWLEKNPGADRRKIPWDIILIEEREKTGSRTFKNFIFPWKD